MLTNPIFIKEILTKMRGRQSPQVLAVLASVMGLFIIWCYYESMYYIVKYGGTMGGRDGWEVGFTIQALLIWLLAPALTANAISQEREQQTWEMLIFTLLSPRDIILGKLFARLIPMSALLGAFFPFMFFCFAVGGVGAHEFISVYAVFSVWVLFLSITGLFMSWLFKRTPTAIATSYLVVFVLVIGTTLVNATLSFGGSWNEASWIWWMNPIRVSSALLSLRNNEHDAVGVILLSTTTYAAVGTFLLWRMLSRFRSLSIE